MKTKMSTTIFRLLGIEILVAFAIRKLRPDPVPQLPEPQEPVPLDIPGEPREPEPREHGIWSIPVSKAATGGLATGVVAEIEEILDRPATAEPMSQLVTEFVKEEARLLPGRYVAWQRELDNRYLPNVVGKRNMKKEHERLKYSHLLRHAMEGLATGAWHSTRDFIDTYAGNDWVMRGLLIDIMTYIYASDYYDNPPEVTEDFFNDTLLTTSDISLLVRNALSHYQSIVTPTMSIGMCTPYRGGSYTMTSTNWNSSCIS